MCIRDRLTTFTAQELRAEGRTEAGEDAVAAAVLLQGYLDARCSGEQLDFGCIDLPQRHHEAG